MEFSQPLAAPSGAARRAGGHGRASHQHREQRPFKIHQKQLKVANGRFPQIYTTAFLQSFYWLLE